MSNTGSKYLDSFFSYGHFIHCMYGKAATGKTNLCLVASSYFSKQGKVVFVDTEGSFSVERLKQIDPALNLDNILMFRARSLMEQEKVIEAVLALKEKVKLIIVDSLSVHYRKALQQKQDPNPRISRQLSILSEISRAGIPVIFTCQVYTGQDNSIHPVGGKMIKNWSSCIVRLENEGKRMFFLEKHPKLASISIPFQICDKGIEL